MTTTILALDLGTTTGWRCTRQRRPHHQRLRASCPQRFEGGGMRFLRFKRWLTECCRPCDGIDALHFEEVRRHVSDRCGARLRRFPRHLTAWCEHHQIPVPGRAGRHDLKSTPRAKATQARRTMIAAVRHVVMPRWQ